MFDIWHGAPNGPKGREIRAQLGRSYFLIPEPRFGFTCRWHRMEQSGHTDPQRAPGVNYGRVINPLEEHLAWERDQAMTPLPCELARVSWPDGVKADTLVSQDLPLAILPDGRRVFFVPDVKSYGSVLPHAWRPLVINAKAARGPVLAHAYEITLKVLQFWHAIGPQMAKRRVCREELKTAGQEIWRYNCEVDPSGRDEKVESWIFYWARQLYDDPTAEFTPSTEAFEVLERAIGYEATSIESMIRRDSRRRARRLPATQK